MDETANPFTDGEAYEILMGRWSRLVGDRFIDWLDPPKGLRWLDVGCGNGAFTERIVRRCAPAEVVAIDPSEEQLRYARVRQGIERTEFQLGDAQKLAFADGSFDAAVMALVISFLPDPARALAEVVRVVRPGGWVATYMWDIPGGGLPMAPVQTAMKSLGLVPAQPPSASVSDRDSMRALWEKAELEAVELCVIRIPTTYADFDDYWNASTLRVGPLGKAVEGMAPAMREQVRSRLREQLSTNTDGSITLEAFANAVKGRRRG
jgi:ubiquinone/menaquinone biosynthesis C-methylase UbiE